jgi:transcription-repair coupling factor (superfamily II helicase)
MIGYKFIQEKQWNDVHQKLQKLNADASATEFVREIERGNLDVSIGTTQLLKESQQQAEDPLA